MITPNSFILSNTQWSKKNVFCFCFLFPLIAFSLAFSAPQKTQDESEEESIPGIESLSEEQSESLKQRLKEIEQGFAASREQRHREAFKKFQEISDNDLELYNYYIECVEIIDYSDEDEQRSDRRASKEFDDWKKRLNEDVDRAEFASMLRTQIDWLTLIKRAEILTRSYGPEAAEAQLAEMELAPQAIALVEKILENGETYGKHFRDLNRPVLGSPLAKATGLGDGVYKPKLIPQAPLQIDNLYRQFYISPGIKEQNIAQITTGWNKIISAREQIMRINYAIRKKQARDRQRASRSNNRDTRRYGDFEESVEYKSFQERSLPVLIWQRERDRFKAGGEVEAAKNMYRLITEYPDHYMHLQWINSLNDILRKAEQERKKEQQLKEQNAQAATKNK